jgi:ECF sigma factor
VALEDALKSWRRSTLVKAKFVERRLFNGLSVEERAEVLKVSPETPMRDWTFARAWLKKDMKA